MVLKPLVEKEVKDLIRDPRIWLPVLLGFLILPVMGYVQNIFISQQIATDLTRKLSVEVQYIGGSQGLAVFSSTLNNSLALNNIAIAPTGSFPEKADALLIINASSIEDLVMGGRVSAYIVYKISLASLTMGSEVPQRVSSALTEASRLYLAGAKNLSSLVGSILSPSIAPQIPYDVERKAIIGGVDHSGGEFAALSALFIPIIVTIIMMSVLQYSATSMAVENEEKTLEILFSMPIPRWSIVIAKLSASAVIGGLSVLGFAVGFLIYQSLLLRSLESIPQNISTISAVGGTQIQGSFISIPPEIQDLLRIRLGSYSHVDLLNLLVPSPLSIAILAIYIIEATIFMGVIGIFIGGLSNDVRMALTISSSISPLLLVFALSAFYLDPQGLSSLLSLSNPMTGAVIYSRIAFSGLSHGPEVYLYLAISGAMVIALIYLSGKVLNLNLEAFDTVRRRAQRIFRIKR